MSWGTQPPPTEDELLADVRHEIVTLVMLCLLFLVAMASLVYGWFPVYGSIGAAILNGVLIMQVWNDLDDSRERLKKYYENHPRP